MIFSRATLVDDALDFAIGVMVYLALASWAEVAGQLWMAHLIRSY